MYYAFNNPTNAYTGAQVTHTNLICEAEYREPSEKWTPSPNSDAKYVKSWLSEGLKCTPLESDNQKCIHIPPEVELLERVKSMLDTCWAFDPHTHSASGADEVLDPLQNFTRAEKRWFAHMTTEIAKAKIERTRCESVNVEITSPKFSQSEQELSLDIFDLTKELDSFYGDPVTINGLQPSNGDVEEGYADEEVALLCSNEDTLSGTSLSQAFVH
ncbi:MAG: hypothetical protein Q9187_001178 [Circinaria calcarea]